MSLRIPAHAGVTLGGERQHRPGVGEGLAHSSPNAPFEYVPKVSASLLSR